jgi:hypothetical protein
MTIRRAALSLLLCSSAVMAQNDPVLGRLLPQLSNYFGLTNAQVVSLERLASDYNSFSVAKQIRIAQVQSELNDETARPQLDALALGQRYLEIEAICRQLRDRLTQNRTKAAAIFTPRQQPLLKALEDAYKLMPVISEAATMNILTSPPVQAVALLTPNSLSAVTGVLVGVVPVAACQAPSSGTVIMRNGDFTGDLTGIKE